MKLRQKGMVTNMWAYESVFYQIYPMGFCGVPFENDGIQRHEIKRVEDPPYAEAGSECRLFLSGI
jgi:hypothetical protein